MNIFKLVGSIFIDTDEANKSIQKTQDSTDTFAEKLAGGAKKAGQFAAGVAAAAGTAAVAIGVKAVNAASDFEDSFAQVNTLLSDQTDLEAYKQSIIDLSNQMGVSTSEISSAVYSAMSAGVDEAEAVAFVANSMKLAEGGFTDTTTAVDVLTTALNAYGEESGLTAESVSDMLITTQNLGKTTVDELASYMGKAIPTAKAYGVEMDDLSAMYAVLTSNGIATADSTTLINAMLGELGKQGSGVDIVLHEMTEHIQEGGMSFGEMMEAGWDLTDVLSLLDESAQESGKSMIDMFSSQQAGKGAQVLWSNAEKLNDVVSQMGDSAGATEKAFETMHDTMSTKIATLQQNFENMALQLGEALLPVVMEVVDVVIQNLPTIIGFFNMLVPVISQMFSELLPPLLELAQQLFPVIMDLLTALLPVITEIVSSILPVVIQLLQSFLPPIMQLVQALLPVVLDLITALLPILSPIIELLTPILELVVALLEPFLSMIDVILPPLIKLLVFFTDVALQPLQVILNVVSEAAKKFAETFVGAWQYIKDKSKAPINTILGFMNSMVSGAVTAVNGIIRAINRVHIDVPGWLQKITGMQTFGFNIAELSAPQIPLLAKGGELNSGSAIVGEDGPELLQTNGSRTRVTPLNDNNNAFVGLEQKLDRMIELLENGFGVYLNGNAVVGQLAPEMNKRLGQMADKDRRMVAI